MRQLTLNIKENKFQAFLEFIKTLDYVEIPEAEKKPWLIFRKVLDKLKKWRTEKLKNKLLKIYRLIW